MKKIAVLTLATLLSACSMLPTTTETQSTTIAPAASTAKVVKSSIVGTYQGDLPCADCEKIQAKLVIKADDSYQYDTVYFKNSKTHAYTEKGKLVWDKNKKDVVRLPQSGDLAVKFTKQYAEICDADGEPVKDSQLNYKLSKIK